MVDTHIESLEASDLPRSTIEAASDALGFIQEFNDYLVDLGIVSSDADIDVYALEAAFEGFVAEISAASIFLSSFSGVNKMLEASIAVLEKEKDAPALIVQGYKKLAERVAKTQKALMAAGIDDDSL